MTQDAIKALSDSELLQVNEWIRDEQKARADHKKRETIAKIRELGRTVGVSIKVEETKGKSRRMGKP
jgi:hypothetical protein